MSADNATFIQKRADQLWWVWDGSMSQELEGTNTPEGNATARSFTSYSDALTYAYWLDRDEDGMGFCSEYGIRVKPPEVIG